MAGLKGKIRQCYGWSIIFLSDLAFAAVTVFEMKRLLISEAEQQRSTGAYEMMVNPVTTLLYAAFLNAALPEGAVRLEGKTIAGFYPADEFHGVKHESQPTHFLGAALDARVPDNT